MEGAKFEVIMWAGLVGDGTEEQSGMLVKGRASKFRFTKSLSKCNPAVLNTDKSVHLEAQSAARAMPLMQLTALLQ